MELRVMKKSWVVGLMASTLALGTVLAGCSSERAEGPTKETPTDHSADSQGGKAAEPKKDITVSIYDRGNFPKEEGTLESNRWTKWINENGPANVTFVPVPRSQSKDKLNVMFASASAPDIIFEYNMDIKNELFNQKLLMPIDEMVEQYSTTYKSLLEQYPELRKLGNKSDGKLYEFGRVNQIGHVSALLIRKDWLDKLELEVPETTDELFEVAKAFAELDPDANGKDDTYGIALSSKTGQMIDHMFQAVGWVVQDGELIYDLERTKTAVAYRKKLYDEGVVDKDFLTDTKGEKARADFVSGKLGIFGSGNPADTLNTYTALKTNNSGAEVIPMLLPKSEYGQFSPSMNAPLQMVAVVNRGTENPDAVMKYVDFLVEEQTQIALTQGLEGVHYTMEDGCPKPIDLAKNQEEVKRYGDYTMLTSAHLLFGGQCKTSTYDPNDPIQKDVIEILAKADELYVNKDRPIAQFTHPEWVPALTKDIQTITSSTANIGEIWNKAVVGGPEFSVDRAYDEFKKEWDATGGKKVEDWYKNWYAENKDKALFTPDIYSIKK